MKRDFIFDIYKKVKEARDRELERILKMLRPKAAGDPEIQEVLQLLENWLRRENSSKETAASNGESNESNKDVSQ
jgi:transcriptional regulator GlxA family with amidase domain